MDSSVHVAVDDDGAVLRYAKALLKEASSLSTGKLRLVHAGEFTSGESEAKGPASVVRAQLSDLAANRFHVILHPWDCVAFTVRIPEDAPDRQKLILDEASRLLDLDPESPPHLVTNHMRSERQDGTSLDWIQVAFVPSSFSRMWADRLDFADSGAFDFVLSTVGVAHLLERRMQSGYAGIDVGLGWYSNGIEVTIVGTDGWLFSGQLRRSHSSDTGFFLATLLNRLGLGQRGLGDVVAYGPSISQAGLAALETTFGRPTLSLDDSMPGMSQESGECDWQTEFASCVSALLGERTGRK